MVMLDDNSKKVLLISLGVILMLFSTIGMQVVEDDSVLVTAKTINNETTGGWTSSNISMNGSRWTGDGLLASNLKNDSQLNMSGLVAYWSMDESSGTTAHQVNTESGLINITNQGTLYNMNTGLNNCTGNCSGWSSSGRIGNGLAFDGVDDYVSITDNSSLNLSKNFVISLWFKSPLTGYHYFWAKNTYGANYPPYGVLYSNGNIEFTIYNGTTGYSLYADSGTIISNQWYHAVFQYSEDGWQKIYINGVLKKDANIGIFTLSTNNFDLVLSPAGWGQPFNGSIDEVSIWNRALNASEVAILYNTSMRNISMPLILNQTASTNNVIDKVKMNYLYGDNYHNVSLYSKQNGTTIWSLITTNALNNTWYSIANRYHNMDFGIQLNGNGSNTTFLQSLQWDEGVYGDTNYYTNITGGGGVSFNGSAVDLNGSTLYNGSNQAGTFNHSNLTRLNWSESGHTSDDSKVGTSGGIYYANTSSELTSTLLNISLKPVFTSDVTIQLAPNITYTGNFIIPSVVGNGYSFYIIGSKTLLTSGTITSYSNSWSTNNIYIGDNIKSWTSNIYNGTQVVLDNDNTTVGKTFFLINNNATALFPGSGIAGTPTTYQVFNITSIITTTSGTILLNYAENLVLRDIKIVSPAGAYGVYQTKSDAQTIIKGVNLTGVADSSSRIIWSFAGLIHVYGSHLHGGGSVRPYMGTNLYQYVYFDGVNSAFQVYSKLDSVDIRYSYFKDVTSSGRIDGGRVVSYWSRIIKGTGTDTFILVLNHGNSDYWSYSSLNYKSGFTVFEDINYASWGVNYNMSVLTGSGNAYSCLDSTGKPFRKATACDA